MIYMTELYKKLALELKIGKNNVVIKCKFLISVFEKSLHKFSDRALEFDIWELEKKQVKGQIGKMNTGI